MATLRTCLTEDTVIITFVGPIAGVELREWNFKMGELLFCLPAKKIAQITFPMDVI